MKKQKRLLAFLVSCLFAVTLFSGTAMDAFAEEADGDGGSTPAVTTSATESAPADSDTETQPPKDEGAGNTEQPEVPVPETPSTPEVPRTPETPELPELPEAPVLPDGVPEITPAVLTFTVRFFDWDGTQMGSDHTITQGEAVSPPQETVRENYRFLGWEPNVLGGSLDNVQADIDFTARYEALLSYSITINYIFADGTQAYEPTIDTFYMGEPVNKSYLSPEIEGYSANLLHQDVSISAIDQDYIYSIIYTPEGNTPYKVEHYLQKAGSDPQDYTNGYEIQINDTENLQGQTDSQALATPNPYPGFSPPAVMPTAMIAGNGETVLKIYYTRNQYAVYFNTGDGGSYIAPIAGQYGDTITLPPNPTRAGYNFNGWNPASSPTFSMPASDITLTAKWTPLSNTQYSLVYWIEKTTSTSASPAYEYVGSASAIGTSGMAPVVPGSPAVTMPLASTYYTYNSTKTLAELSGAVIRGDGSTVVNVYYNRNSYTIKFSFGNLYKLTVNGVTYTNSYSFTAKVGAPLGNLWPIDPPVPKNGHKTEGEFVGWESSDMTYVTRQYILDTSIIVSAGSDGLSASWDEDVRSILVHYNLPNLDGSIDHSKDQTVTASSTTTSWNAKTFLGFTLTGSSNQTIVNNAVTFNYTRNNYTLSYYNGNTPYYPGGGTQPLSVPYETSLQSSTYNVTLSDANRPGYLPAQYRFDGWYTTPGGIAGTKFDFATEKMPAANLILYAKWVPVTYTVTFNPSNGGSTFTQSVAYLATATQPVAPTKAGYTFVGWFKAQTDTLKYVFNFPVTGNLELTARYVANNNISYNVIYKLNNGTVWQQQTYSGKRVGDSVTAKAITIPGYLPDKLSDTITLNATGNVITFIYTPQTPIKYYIRYQDAGGAPMPGHPTVEKQSTNNSVTENYAPIPGYYPNYYQQTLALTNVESQNVITFVYRPNPQVNYTVISYWENLDGSYTVDAVVKQSPAGATVNETPSDTAPTKDGVNYVYKSALSSPSKVVASNGTTVVRLYYDRARYTVTFTLNLLDGQSRGSLVGQTTFSNIRYGETINHVGGAPQIVADYGYQFGSWAPSFDGGAPVTANASYTATPEKDLSKWGTITYKPNGATGNDIVSEPFLFGSQQTLQTLQTLQANGFSYLHFDFVGWNTAFDGSGDDYGDGQSIIFNENRTPGGNLTLYAQWVPEGYNTVRYLPNGGTGTLVDLNTYYPPTSATLLNNPPVGGFSYSGYTFVGWNTQQNGGRDPQYDGGESYEFVVGSKDLILYAQWQRDDSQWATIVYDKNSDDATGTMASEPNLLQNKSHTLALNTYTRLHYKFKGWSTTSGPSATVNYADGASITPADGSTITLYAVWQEDAKYKIVYHSNPPAGVSVADVEIDSPAMYSGEWLDVVLQPTFQFNDQHYVFVRWDSNAAGNGNSYVEGSDVTLLDQDVELFAVWEAEQRIEVTYKDGYSANAGIVSEYYLAPGEFETLSVWDNAGASAFLRNGYYFLYWDATWTYESTNHNAFAYGNTSIGNVNYSITFTAQWAPYDYAVAYNLNGGVTEGVNPTHYTVETGSFTLINPVKPGYTFQGWSGTGVNGVRTNVTVPVGSVGERSYVANWVKDPAQWSHISFANSNPSFGSIAGTLDYEGVIGLSTAGQLSLPSVSPKQGYVFDHWSAAIPANYPTQNLVIVAHWKAVQPSSPGGDSGSSEPPASTSPSSSSSTSRPKRQATISSDTSGSSSVVSSSESPAQSSSESAALVASSSGQSSSEQVISEAASQSEMATGLFGGMLAPLGGPNKHDWALVNLLVAILTTLLSVVLLVRYFKKKQEEPEKQGNLFRVLAIITGFLAPVLFFFTENILREMVLVDGWTLLMIILLAVQLVFILLLRKGAQDKDKQAQP